MIETKCMSFLDKIVKILAQDANERKGKSSLIR